MKSLPASVDASQDGAKSVWYGDFSLADHRVGTYGLPLLGHEEISTVHDDPLVSKHAPQFDPPAKGETNITSHAGSLLAYFHKQARADSSEPLVFCLGLMVGALVVSYMIFAGYFKMLFPWRADNSSRRPNEGALNSGESTGDAGPSRRQSKKKESKLLRRTRNLPGPSTGGTGEESDWGSEPNHGATGELAFTEEFPVTSAAGNSTLFRWMTPSEASAAGLPHADAPVEEDSEKLAAASVLSGGLSSQLVPPPWSEETVRKTLSDHGIDVEAWDDGNVQRLASELCSRKTFLVVAQNGVLHRTAEILTIVVQSAASPDQVVACEDDKPVGSDEHSMNISETIPSIWFSPTTESITCAARRCLKVKLGLPEGAVKLRWGKLKACMEEEASSFYPGLTTVVRRMLVQGTLTSGEEARAPNPVRENAWTWKGWSEVDSLARTKLRKTMMLFKDEYAYVPLPWTTAEVIKQLELHGVQAEDFDMSLEELSLKLSQGELSFEVSGGRLLCIKDMVQLRILSFKCNACLVQNDAANGLQWPCVTRQLGECCWDTAYRLLSTRICLDKGNVPIGIEPLDVPSASKSRIRSRQFMFTADISEKKLAKCKIIHGDKL